MSAVGVPGQLLLPSVCACSVVQSWPTLCDPMDCSPPGSSVHGISEARITRVGCHLLLQGIFPTQGSNPGLLHLLPWQVDSLPLSHLGSPSVPNAGKQRKEVGIIKGQDAGQKFYICSGNTKVGQSAPAFQFCHPLPFLFPLSFPIPPG